MTEPVTVPSPEPTDGLPQDITEGISGATPARPSLAGVGWLFAGSLVLCLGVYLALAVPGAWFPTAPARAIGAKELTLARGTGSVVRDELVVTASDPTQDVLITATTSFKSREYPVVAWIAIDLPELADVHLLWRTDYRPDKLNSVRVTVESGRTLPVVVAGHPDWIGNITGLALSIRGKLAQPVHVRGVVAKPMGAVEVLGDRTGEWLAFEGWTGTSINTVTGGSDIQGLPLPPLLATVVLLAILAATAWLRLRHRQVLPAMFLVIPALFVAAWALLDARWSWNLARQVAATAHQYAGKDLQEKHYASEDGAVVAFVEKARTVLPAAPVRVFVVSDAAYFRNRAAYHLYPHNAFSEPVRNDLPHASMMRPGDWLLVLQRRGMQYDQAKQSLRWDNQSVSAELKLFDHGNALFRIL